MISWIGKAFLTWKQQKNKNENVVRCDYLKEPDKKIPFYLNQIL